MAACLAVVLFIGIPYTVQYLDNDKDGGYTVATKMTFQAKILEVQKNALLVEPLVGTQERELAATILISTDDLSELKTIEYVATAQVGDIVQIGYLKEGTSIGKGIIAVYRIVPIDTGLDGNQDGYDPLPNNQTADEEVSEQDPLAN